LAEFEKRKKLGMIEKDSGIAHEAKSRGQITWRLRYGELCMGHGLGWINCFKLFDRKYFVY
jgi:hypothetical protein